MMAGDAVERLLAGLQWLFQAAGPHAARIADLWWIFFWVCLAAWVLPLLALAVAVARARRRAAGAGEHLVPSPHEERRHTVLVGASLSVVVLALFGLLLASFFTDRALASRPGESTLTIEITGHQWWWEVRYQDPEPTRIFSTANEIHIPIGRPVELKLKAQDVIHSFWVPALHGKRDLIPGIETILQIQADRAGVFRGQCAEFCGYQHAKMAISVVALTPEDFDAWLSAQRTAPPPPTDTLALRGQQVFLGGTCPMCHAIQGTSALSRNGPDLTHVASRREIAAGTLPNTRDHLGGWIVDPQTAKPGNHMPPSSLSGEDLQALLAYLETLK